MLVMLQARGTSVFAAPRSANGLRFQAEGRKSRTTLALVLLQLFSHSTFVVLDLVMVALWNRPDHYIFMLCFHVCSSFFLLLFFPRLISAAADWMSAILPHMVWP